ncbi:alkaline phosphatase-like protein [Podospora didyma]|uniref:alkaline phosphatase n=1 Tax=Podospora didyma TaxID=330526 RepID=A0AAE0K1Y1_9PEZI|nr:alkaline phosphatase-like protein [Podospora didyma]
MEWIVLELDCLLTSGLAPVLAVLAAIPFLEQQRWRMALIDSYDAKATDPPLLERNSEVKSYTTSKATYPGLRVFYRRHQQADRLPRTPAPIPLLVFVHGLGGSVAQFNSLLTSLTPIASCLAVDLPGCGRSEFAPRSWDAYSTDALVELLETVIEDYREKDEGQGVVLIGHSMGTPLALLLAKPRGTPRTELHKHIVGLVAMCPAAPAFKPNLTRFLRILLSLTPAWLFDFWRGLDARGGTESASVRRFVGADADEESKRLQVLYNAQSKSAVWLRTAYGLLPKFKNGEPEGGLPPIQYWQGLQMPVFLIGGEGDNVTPAKTVTVAAEWNIAELSVEDFARQKNPVNPDETEDPMTPNDRPAGIPALPLRPKKVVQTKILPRPANHAMLYMPTSAPVLAGLISDFLAAHVTGRLDLGWQLQYLCQDGKWDVKNLEKWQKVAPVSEKIGNVFRAMKTLREVDEVHCPRQFVRGWGGVVKDIIDISHDTPVYDPQGLEEGGIKYHKFPTVSKVPPTDAEVEGFIALVDKIREEQKARPTAGENSDWVIGVHCHYGFNRTGFFIVCYLVERCGYTPRQAIEHFAEQRPKGIKHAHFKDRLYRPTAALSSCTGGSPTPSEHSDRRAEEEEDNALHGTAVPARSSRRWVSNLREVALFAWALLATAAVIVLAVVLQHRNAVTSNPASSVYNGPAAVAATNSKTPAKRNLIFMVSDGMGPASLSLTRSFRQLVYDLPIDNTLQLDRHFWDSAAGATAFSCGRKSYNGAISMLPDYSPCGTVLEAAKRAGYHTGLVVTTDITDATPACFAAHVHHRIQEDEIALQEVGEGVLGRTVDLILGGGRCHFLPNTTAGSCRADDVNVAGIAQEKHGWTYANDRAGFDALAMGKNVSLPLLGLFASRDVPFEIDRRHMADVYPSLSEMAATALAALEEATKDSDKGFFLMIEGSRIDHAGHINDPAAQVREVLEYDKAFKTVLDFLDSSDTEGVLVATSDHETGGLATAWQGPGELPVYNWHPSILARAEASSEHLALLLEEHLLAFQDESPEDLREWINNDLVVKRLGIQNALEVEINALASNPIAATTLFARMVSIRARVGWSTHGHSAVDVNVYSSGGDEAQKIRGNVENTDIGKFLREYLRVDVDSITKELKQKLKYDGVEAAKVAQMATGGESTAADQNGNQHPKEWLEQAKF